MEIICVPLIMAIVYAVIEFYKSTIAKTNDTLLRIIPIIGGVLGLVAGIAFFYCCPNLISATNVGSAIVIGLASGLSATGCNQIFKQLKKFGVDVKQPEIDVQPEQTNSNQQTENLNSTSIKDEAQANSADTNSTDNTSNF